MLRSAKTKLLKWHLTKHFSQNLVKPFCIKYPPEIEKARQKNKLERPTDRIPIERTVKIVKDDFKRLRNLQFTVPEPKIPKAVDILIVGGGIIGSSIAYWLKHRAPDSFDLMLAERDPTYTRSSTTLSVGGIRQQFSLEENIQLSLYSAEFLRNIKQHLSVLGDEPPDICFQPHGYLFLATEAGEEQMVVNHKLQKECGAKVELLRPKELASKFPWLNLDGITMGSYGIENEGWFDPWALLSAFKKKACSLGAKFVNGEIIGFELEKIPMCRMEIPNAPHMTTHYAYLKDDEGEIHTIEFHMLVVAAGPYSGEIAKMLQIGSGPDLLKEPLPIEPRKRYVYTFHCENGPGLDMPLVIDPSGVYCRREGLGGKYICGRSPIPSEEPDISNLEVDYNFFETSVWPELAHRLPAFECIKVSSAWAGYYDYNTLDQNALFGAHPFYPNVHFVTGFSGHGIQMAPAIGRAAAELLLDKSYHTIDMSRFGLHRMFSQQPLLEKNIV